ncbi:hypothetical protein EYZ11_000927 [Aspergillus tanneri]|uniref:Uncharacterized protein n=1 Tax=Aspergillus tanneri TaxID=1220188 RepID=A0A4S3JVS9_9EURO|nr:hypothetical protein EYZ11_000927 [Aspergillus tanneri]
MHPVTTIVTGLALLSSVIAMGSPDKAPTPGPTPTPGLTPPSINVYVTLTDGISQTITVENGVCKDVKPM